MREAAGLNPIALGQQTSIWLQYASESTVNFVSQKGGLFFVQPQEFHKLAPTLGQEQWNITMNGQFFRQRKPPVPPHPMGWKWAQVFSAIKYAESTTHSPANNPQPPLAHSIETHRTSWFRPADTVRDRS